jgi:PilZ domain-containing protein
MERSFLYTSREATAGEREAVEVETIPAVAQSDGAAEPGGLEPAAHGADTVQERSPRQQLLLGVEIAGLGRGLSTKHRIKNLSATGARVDGAAFLTPGAILSVSIGALEAIEAVVVWVDGPVAGLKFAEPIDPDAARSKTIVSNGKAIPEPVSRDPSPTAGWVADLESPY